ncbi:hypothetical protein JOF53_004749 [Crossiella equi]|uniref:Toxin-antitoxin system HicB family antitoxin n=1 Tax=Crossiella equi TaxID=130796 RepID=A0ABS5AHX4_9PSEU|nr:toxin-antitoxin system HicB family antitoxin [Crossiella equi]MBP2475877.1 hypothetical protein [Crossiella equi]
MDLTLYVEKLRQELAVAAETGGAEARALAERLTAPLDSAVRLTLLDALSAAAGEITQDLAPGSVDLRLRGGNPAFVVTKPPAEEVVAAPAPAPVVEPESDEGAMSRINLRLSEQLKARVEAAAAAEKLSVNAWLVRAAAAALEPPRATSRRGPVGQSLTGWVS